MLIPFQLVEYILSRVASIATANYIEKTEGKTRNSTLETFAL